MPATSNIAMMIVIVCLLPMRCLDEIENLLFNLSP